MKKFLAIFLFFFCLNVFAQTDSLQVETQIREINLAGNKKLIERKGNTLIFNVENSDFAKAGNAIDVLQRSPSLSINSAGNILLKNRPANVLINGRNTNLSETDLNNYLAGLHSEDIKRIEIQDVASSEREASSQDGVVNIILKNPKGFRTVFNNSYLYRKENYAGYNSGLNLNCGTEKWNVYSSVNYSEGNDLGKSNSTFNYFNGKKQTNSSIFDQNNNNFGARLGMVFYLNEKNEIGIEGYFNKTKSIFDSFGTLNFTGNETETDSKNHSFSETPSDLWYVTANYNLK